MLPLTIISYHLMSFFHHSCRQFFYHNLNSTFYLIDIPDEICRWYTCPTDMHWPSISWKVYGSTRLAWFLMKLNGIRDQNIFDQLKAGTKIKYLEFSKYVNTMLTNMEQDQNQAK